MNKHKIKLKDFDELCTLRELIDYTAAKYGEQEAFSYREKKKLKKVNYIEFQKEIDSFVTYYSKKEIRNCKIGILGENSYEWLLAYFGITSSGNIAVPIDKNLNISKIIEIIDDCKLDKLIYSETYSDVVSSIRNSNIGLKMQFFSMNETYQNIMKYLQLIDSGKIEKSDIYVDKDSPAMIVYTSGTTGSAKGVVLTHYNIMSDTYGTGRNVDGKALSNSVLVLPLHHMFSIVAGVTTVMEYGVAIFINNSLKYIMKDIKQIQPDYMAMVPLMVENIYKNISNSVRSLKRDKALKLLVTASNCLLKLGIDIRKKAFAHIREQFGGKLMLVTCGGACLDKKYVRAFRDWGVQLIVGYGMTECAPIIAVNCNNQYRDGSVGKVLCCCEVKIDAEPGKEGEILVRGNNVTKGYYGKVDEKQVIFEGEWLRTGDIGFFDKDSYLYITGRKKNLIILSNGENVSPEELEMKIKTIQFVKDVLVYGENDSIIASILLDTEKYPDCENQINSEIKSINKVLPLYKNITQIMIQHIDFKRTSISKIVRDKTTA